MLYPETVEVLLAFQDKLTLCETGAVPEPVKDSCSEGLEALLAMVTLAEADPVDCVGGAAA